MPNSPAVVASSVGCLSCLQLVGFSKLTRRLQAAKPGESTEELAEAKVSYCLSHGSSATVSTCTIQSPAPSRSTEASEEANNEGEKLENGSSGLFPFADVQKYIPWFPSTNPGSTNSGTDAFSKTDAKKLAGHVHQCTPTQPPYTSSSGEEWEKELRRSSAEEWAEEIKVASDASVKAQREADCNPVDVQAVALLKVLAESKAKLRKVNAQDAQIDNLIKDNAELKAKLQNAQATTDAGLEKQKTTRELHLSQWRGGAESYSRSLIQHLE